MYKWIIAIDCGLTGAIIIFNRFMQVVKVIRMPTVPKSGFVKSRVHAQQLFKVIKDGMTEVAGTYFTSEVCVFIEEPPAYTNHPMMAPQISLIESFGIVMGVISSIGYTWHLVSVQSWKNRYDLIGKKSKRYSIQVAGTLNPEIGKIALDDADIADAVIVGNYGAKYIIGHQTPKE